MYNKTIKDKILESPKRPCNMAELFDELQHDSPVTSDEYIYFAKASVHSLSTLKLFLESKGLNLVMQPEFYTTGINWNWQWLWYDPRDKWIQHEDGNYYDNIHSGTYMYGDNNEYPTREKAELGAIELAFRLLENNAIEIGKPDEN